jgi:hypothetical protein
MIPLNLLNPGDALNLSGVTRGGRVSPGLRDASCLEFIGSVPILTRQLLVGKFPPNDVPHIKYEALNVSHIPVV